MNQVFAIEYTGCDMTGAPISGTRSYPAYSCGHCSRTVLMNDQRVRLRVTCHKCGRWLCEQSELCQDDCTPLYDIARDHTWDDPKWARLLPGIMGGATTKEEAVKSGLIKE